MAGVRGEDGRWFLTDEQLFAFPGVVDPDGAAPAGGQKLILAMVARVASRAVIMNAQAVGDTRLGLATFLVAAATWGWPGVGGEGARPSAALFLGAVVLLNVALLAAGLLVWAVSVLALHGEKSLLPPPVSALISWAEQRQHVLLLVALSLLLLSYTVIPIRAISVAHFAAPIVSRALTSLLQS